MTNVTQFNREVQDFMDRLAPDHFRPFLKKIALDLMTRIVLKTPVDLGRARSNWQTSIGTPIETSKVWNPPGESGGGTNKAAATQAAITQGVATIESITNPYIVVWISNNVIYIEALEDGHSRVQAPRGMVKVSIEETRAAFG
jgi:hypothetical protein